MDENDVLSALADILREEGFAVSLNKIGHRLHLEIECHGSPELVHISDQVPDRSSFRVPVEHPNSIDMLIGHLKDANGD